MGNTEKNTFFNISVTVALVGFLVYFVREIFFWVDYDAFDEAFPLVAFISCILLIIAIITLIVLLYVGMDVVVLFRIVVMLFSLYILSYALATIFYPFMIEGNWNIPNEGLMRMFKDTYSLSFINLIILGAAVLFLFVFSIVQIKKEEITSSEKFTYILVLSLMLVFDIANVHYTKALLFVSVDLFGFFYLPIYLEMILLALLIILLTIGLILNDSEIVSLLGLVMLNIFFISVISTITVNTGFDFSTDTQTLLLAIGNIVLILGTILTFISSIISARNQLGGGTASYQ